MKHYVEVTWWIVMGTILLGLCFIFKDCLDMEQKHKMKKKEAYEKCLKEEKTPRCDCQTLYLERHEKDDSCD